MAKCIRKLKKCIKKQAAEKNLYFDIEEIKEGYKIHIGEWILYTGDYDEYHKSTRICNSFKRRLLNRARDVNDVVYQVILKCQ